ncbi:LysR family transcriptional regulator [Inquilinus limosus]
MDLRDLRIFASVCELSSFTKAAVHLGLAQPTISRVIGELEAEWGGPLFYRTGRGVALSELGEEALVRVRGLLKDADRVSEDLRGLSRLPSGFVSIALPPSVVTLVIPDLLNQLRRELPGIHLRIREGFSDENERWLAEGKIDIGIYSKYWEGAPSPDRLLLPSRLVLAGFVPEDTLRREIDFADLARFPLVLPPPTNGLRMIVDAVARRLKVPLNIVADADSTVAQKSVSAHCGCFMIKAVHTIAEEQSQGLVASSVIRNPYVNRHVVLVTSHQKPLSRAGREVAERITRILQVVSQPRGPEPTGSRNPDLPAGTVGIKPDLAASY